MANKITLLRSTDDGLGGTQRIVLFWYVIAPRIKDSLNNDVAPQTSNQLQNANGGASKYVNSVDLAALDSGDAGFEIAARLQTAGETNAAFSARLKLEQAARQTAWIAQQQAIYGLAGTGVN